MGRSFDGGTPMVFITKILRVYIILPAYQVITNLQLQMVQYRLKYGYIVVGARPSATLVAAVQLISVMGIR